MSYVTKPETIRLLGPVDIAAIKKLILRTSERVWDMEDERKENKFSCFHHTRHIVFRFIDGMRDHRRFHSNPIWPVWQAQLQPVIERAAASYGFRDPVYPKVMLARLAAGAVIDRHVDGPGSNLHTHKIHIPIQTNEQASIIISDRPFHLLEGHAYEVNNLAPHSVENLGPADRIHLIFEVFDQAEQMAA
jgi:hypothetical protein